MRPGTNIGRGAAASGNLAAAGGTRGPHLLLRMQALREVA
jgi:hypothetical protein